MITEPDFVERATNAYVNQSLSYIRAMMAAGADAIMTVDDYCDNRGPIMGPTLFKRYIAPAIRRQCELTHELGGYFIKHTDGNVWPVLDDLVEIGIDGWHGIQRDIGMDLSQLKKRYGNRLCFFGGVSVETLISGDRREIVREVRSAIDQLGADGGLVVTCSNVLPEEVDLEIYRTMRQAIHKYGRHGSEAE
jgi:uroporphyrinogen decarboxylase